MRLAVRLLASAAVIAGGCSTPAPEPPPLLVVGVDGGERRAIERLWERSELPTLRRLADHGSFAPLATAYGSSPVIWTTIATGTTPAEHGITDFVVSTPAGDVPVSSAVRLRPALWNMLDRVGRRSAVLGWWASWPAESIDGIVVTDRIESSLPDLAHPPELAPDLDRWLRAARAGGLAFGGNAASQLRDRVVTAAAREALGEGYDLVLAYYRSLDLASHDFWHRFEPEAFPDGAPSGARTAETPDPVAEAYRAFDAALGELLAAAPSGTSVLVISDHGFRAEKHDSLQLLIDFDRVLERLGWLRRDAEGQVEVGRSRAWSHASPSHKRQKMLRLSPGSRVEATALQLANDLERVRFDNRRPAFRVREPDARELAAGAELVVEVIDEHATARLLLDDAPLAGAVLHHGRITGGHGLRSHGILIAHGPLFAAGRGDLEISIHDIAPTVLHVLGLPVADDFAGSVASGLLADAVRRRPVRRIASWGRRDGGVALESAEDRRLIEELAALGYLD